MNRMTCFNSVFVNYFHSRNYKYLSLEVLFIIYTLNLNLSVDVMIYFPVIVDVAA
jgi:hypothetical protein